MALNILALHQRDSNGIPVQQWSAVYRLRPGFSPVRLGNNFAVMLLTSVGGTALAAGHIITGGTSGATAIVTAVTGPGTAPGASPQIVCNSISDAVLFQSGEPITTNAGGTGDFYAMQALEYGGGGTDLKKQDAALDFQDKVIAILLNWLWKLNTGTMNWEIIYEFPHPTNPLGLNATHTGLHIFQKAGAPLLGFIYYETIGANSYRVTSPDGVTFTEALTLQTIQIGGSGVSKEYVFENILYFVFSSGQVHVSWNIEDDAIFFAPNEGHAVPGSSAIDWLNLNNRFFRFDADLGTAIGPSVNQPSIYEWTLGTYLARVTWVAEVSGEASGPVMFVDPAGYVIVIYYDTALNLWKTRKLTYAPLTNTWTDNGAIPVILPAPLNVNADRSNGRWQVVVDTDTTPGTPVIYLFYELNDVPPRTIQAFEYVDTVTEMLVLGTGVGDVGMTLPQIRSGGGERFFTVGQPGFKFTGLVLPSPSVGLRIKLRGSGGGTKTVRMRFAKNGQIVTGLATLSNPDGTHGTLNVNNQQIDNWPMDGTEGQFTWLALGDGVPDTSKAKYGFEAV